MSSCIVKCCRNTFRSCKKAAKQVQFYRLPKNEEIKRKWLDLCGITEVSTKNPRVCSVHFDDRDVGTDTGRNLSTLNPTAVPVYNLGAYV
jgi:hypothetical protein